MRCIQLLLLSLFAKVYFNLAVFRVRVTIAGVAVKTGPKKSALNLFKRFLTGLELNVNTAMYQAKT